MDPLPSLHVVFTMDCQPAATRAAPEGPRGWEQSAGAIDGFWTRLRRAGYPATLFLGPASADAHAPLLEEAADAGVELALFVQPQSLDAGSYNRFLGHYPGDEQRKIVARALEGFQDALGRRAQSVRSAMFSANDDTFPTLFELGFRQGSLSSPGRKVGPHATDWGGAATDPHYVDPRDRLQPGDLPFLEVPVTTDAGSRRGGLAPDLALENGTLADWHRPLLEGQLRRMEQAGVGFRALCFTTRNCFAYHAPTDKLTLTLESILDYLAGLVDRYEIVPATLSEIHARYRGNRFS